MVTSDFGPEVEMSPFRACTIKICNLARTCDRIAYELGYGANTMFHRTYFLFVYKTHQMIVNLTVEQGNKVQIAYPHSSVHLV